MGLDIEDAYARGRADERRDVIEYLIALTEVMDANPKTRPLIHIHDTLRTCIASGDHCTGPVVVFDIERYGLDWRDQELVPCEKEEP